MRVENHWLIFALSSTVLTIIVGASSDSFYCKRDPMVYDICRRCPDINDDCETSSSCVCDNVKIFNRGQFGGGSDCQSKHGGNSYCYVSSTSPCTDKQKSRLADTYKNLWHKNALYVSFDACKDGNVQNNDTGNEEVMFGVKITDDILQGPVFEDNSDPGPLFIDGIYDYQDCQAECKDRCRCGAWSLDVLDGKCFLHGVNSCCGQKGKQAANSNFISGYICPRCSSTRNECPCSIDYLLKGGVGCTGGAFGAGGAKEPEYATPTGLIRVDQINTNKDLCACEYRKFPSGISKCRCVLQTCHDQNKNPNGQCVDRRRCRASPLNDTRFPRCVPISGTPGYKLI